MLETTPAPVQRMRNSARRLKELYLKYEEHFRNPDQKGRALYPELIQPNDPPHPYAERWILCRHLPRIMLEDRSLMAVDAMFSIYGLVITHVSGRQAGDLFLEFESDDQVEDVLRAKERLNVGGDVIKCFRIRMPPE